MEQNIETKKISVAHNALNYGAMLGVAVIIISLIFYILNFDTSNFVVWIQLAIYVVGMVLGILNYRKNVNGGYISYGKSLGSGVLIGLFAAVIAGVYVYIFFKFIDPAAVEKLITIKEDEMIQQNPSMTEEQIEMGLSYMRKFMTPLWMAIWGLVMNTFFSLVSSLIISIFTRKVDKSFEANFR